MTEVFDLNQTTWSYNPLVPDLLRTSQLPLPAATAENSLSRTARVLAYAKDTRRSAYWQKKLGDMVIGRKINWTRHASIVSSGRA